MVAAPLAPPALVSELKGLCGPAGRGAAVATHRGAHTLPSEAYLPMANFIACFITATCPASGGLFLSRLGPSGARACAAHHARIGSTNAPVEFSVIAFQKG